MENNKVKVNIEKFPKTILFSAYAPTDDEEDLEIEVLYNDTGRTVSWNNDNGGETQFELSGDFSNAYITSLNTTSSLSLFLEWSRAKITTGKIGVSIIGGVPVINTNTSLNIQLYIKIEIYE